MEGWDEEEIRNKSLKAALSGPGQNANVIPLLFVWQAAV
jgi:hypothetical protein